MKTLIYVILFVFLGCSRLDYTYVISLDDRYRPITSCYKANYDVLTAIIISMKCKKSTQEDVLLCTQGRVIQKFESKKQCLEYEKAMIEKHGEHKLSDDPWENIIN